MGAKCSEQMQNKTELAHMQYQHLFHCWHRNLHCIPATLDEDNKKICIFHWNVVMWNDGWMFVCDSFSFCKYCAATHYLPFNENFRSRKVNEKCSHSLLFRACVYYAVSLSYVDIFLCLIHNRNLIIPVGFVCVCVCVCVVFLVFVSSTSLRNESNIVKYRASGALANVGSSIPSTVSNIQHREEYRDNEICFDAKCTHKHEHTHTHTHRQWWWWISRCIIHTLVKQCRWCYTSTRGKYEHHTNIFAHSQSRIASKFILPVLLFCMHFFPLSFSRSLSLSFFFLFSLVSLSLALSSLLAVVTFPFAWALFSFPHSNSAI